jgi:rare lipoprotein A
MDDSRPRSWALAALGLLISCEAFALPDPPAPANGGASLPAHVPAKRHHPVRQRGKASIYSRRLAHKIMADGTPLDLDAEVAASRQLPLGSKAKVTNLRNGRSTEVLIRDRGPYIPGRIIDLTPKAAARLGFHRGVVPVEVSPVADGPPATAAARHTHGP